MMPPQPTIVLAHGSWQTATNFDALRKELAKLAFPTVAKTMPSSTEDAEQPSFTAQKDAEYLRRSVIEPLIKEEKEIVVVMHSYGGIYGSSAIQESMKLSDRKRRGLKGGVLGLVYIAAFVAPPGMSSLGVFGIDSHQPEIKQEKGLGHSASWKQRQNLVLKTDVEQMALTWSGTCEKTHRDASDHEERRTKQAATTPFRAITGPVSYIGWNTPAFNRKRAYIFCEQDRAIPIEVQRNMARNAGIELSTSFNTSPNPFLSVSREVASAIEGFAKKFTT
ncbi:uncharacterized protein KY384_007496 [Bacidia gigantensis]|uniref:uncharacterized protein n=1 Tax=Bacidia gigantensis TaxID=2732470 RepID=UPI001D058207|nr:uncharacterized protein KY384_007496 [Bacidia gigantensis]KAG8527344.1 hypothetical protein KY384_007496 [Bacidia gigantensis]